MKILDIPQSGKNGLMVSYKHGAGQVRRQYVVPHDPRTAAQVHRRGAMTRAARLWATLNERQFIGWRAAANDLHSHPRLGQSGTLFPHQLYCKINCNLDAIGLPMVLDLPSQPDFEHNPVDQLLITNTNDLIELKLSVLDPAAPQVIVWAAKPCSAGRSYVDHFTLLGVLPAPVLGVSDITALYVRQWGPPPAGSRIFIETIQQINGWQDLPHRLTARVPNP